MDVKARDYDDIFSCPSCGMFFCDPVTVDCGHMFCKVCLEEVECCLKCETNISRLRTASLGVNVLMVRILEKWFPEETELSKMKESGSKLVATNCHKEAIELFSNALLKTPNDVFLRNCRSKVLSISGQFQRALLDAEFLTNHQPNYIQGYIRKAEALHGLSRFDELMTAYLQGLALNPRTSSTRTNLTKVVHQILSPQAEELKSPNYLCQSVAHARNQSISKSLQCLGVLSNSTEGCSSLKFNKGIKCTSGNSENIADSAQNNQVPLESPDERSSHVVSRNLISLDDFECILCLRENFSEHGTALEILDVQYTPDGRCILNTVGRRQFHVATHGICDGYRTAKVKYLMDSPVSSENVSEVTSLLSDVFMDAQSWFASLPHTAQQRIEQCYGNFPQFEPLNAFSSTDGPNWVWFITSILPIDSHAQLDILAMTSLKECLLAVGRVIAFVRQHRWPT